MPISAEHARLAGALEGPHRDPFDRMLIAQAKLEGMPIVSGDAAFRTYAVPVIWRAGSAESNLS